MKEASEASMTRMAQMTVWAVAQARRFLAQKKGITVGSVGGVKTVWKEGSFKGAFDSKEPLKNLVEMLEKQLPFVLRWRTRRRAAHSASLPRQGERWSGPLACKRSFPQYGLGQATENGRQE